MIIREYTDSDALQFLRLARALQTYETAIYDRMIPATEIGNWYISALKTRCDAEDGSILVAELDGKLIGFATVFTRVEQEGGTDEVPYTYAFISHIVVSPDARGMGVGKSLLEECERRARSAGRKWLRLAVFAANTIAREVYERFGFQDYLVTMEKSLD